MHSKSIRQVLLLTALAALVLALGAGQVRAQGEPQNYGEDYAPPDPVWPFPIGSTHPEDGGLFVSASFASYRQTNPLKDQVIGVRGSDFVIEGNPLLTVPVLLGTRTLALDSQQVAGPTNFEPGFEAEVGWKFGDGSAFSVRYLFINEVNLAAAASFAAPNFQVGPNLDDSFLFAPVFNFPNAYNGPLDKGNGTPGSLPGIWNGARVMTEQFLQRTQQWDGIYRVPMYETDTYRLSGLVGPRFTWIWERYKWVTTDYDATGATNPNFIAEYTNVTSNRMYGVHIGCEQECYLGHGFAADIQLQVSGYEDSVKEEAKYQLARGANVQGNPGPTSKHSQVQWAFVPEPEARISLSWFPIEAVEIRAGYNIQAFFNTISMNQPVDFDFGSVNPRYETGTLRIMDGLDCGISIHF